jgi:hypothetical protein
MQTIIRLPQRREDLIAAKVSSIAADKLETYTTLTEEIIHAFQPYKQICDFLAACIWDKEVNYVKTFPEDEAHETSDVREFICYGEYHRNTVPEQVNLFFRLDQQWDDFTFPTFDDERTTQHFKQYIPLLSGTIAANPIFPPLLLEQDELNDKTELSLRHPDKSFKDLYFFSWDYWGKSYLVDRNGDVLEFKRGTFNESKFDFIGWVDNELENIFNPRPEN